MEPVSGSGRVVVYPPTLDWTFLRQRPQQLMSQFARHGWRVFYCQQTQRPGAAMVEVEPGLHVVHDVESFIRGVIPGLAPLVWRSSPELVETLSRYQPAFTVFDYLDDFPEHRSYLPAMFSIAGLVVVTAVRLERVAREHHRRVVRVPNACDYESESAGGAVPSDIARLPHPRIGFVGAWGRWCSDDILLATARALPHASVVLVGPPFGRQIPTAANIHPLGLKRYEDLPAYLAAFDVGIVPFDGSDVSLAANPIKMWQYLAAGPPVVAIATPETTYLSPLVRTANTPEEFAEAVKASLQTDSPGARRERRRFAGLNTWGHRYRAVMKGLTRAGWR